MNRVTSLFMIIRSFTHPYTSSANMNGNDFTQVNKFPEIKVPGGVGEEGLKIFSLFQLRVSFSLTKTVYEHFKLVNVIEFISKYVTHNQTPHHNFKQKSTLSQLNHIHVAPLNSCGVPLGQASTPPPSPMTLISNKQQLKEMDGRTFPAFIPGGSESLHLTKQDCQKRKNILGSKYLFFCWVFLSS